MRAGENAATDEGRLLSLHILLKLMCYHECEGHSQRLPEASSSKPWQGTTTHVPHQGRDLQTGTQVQLYCGLTSESQASWVDQEVHFSTQLLEIETVLYLASAQLVFPLTHCLFQSLSFFLCPARQISKKLIKWINSKKGGNIRRQK